MGRMKMDRDIIPISLVRDASCVVQSANMNDGWWTSDYEMVNIRILQAAVTGQCNVTVYLWDKNGIDNLVQMLYDAGYSVKVKLTRDAVTDNIVNGHYTISWSVTE
jgi:hypothetical protein